MRRQRNTFQVREQDKTPEKELSETERSNLPDREFKQRVLRMLTDLGRRMDEFSEAVKKVMEDIKMNQSEMKNTILEMKNSLEGLKSRVEDTEEWICELDERLEMTQAEQVKEKRIKKSEDSLRDLWDNIKCTNIRVIGVLEGEE